MESEHERWSSEASPAQVYLPLWGGGGGGPASAFLPPRLVAKASVAPGEGPREKQAEDPVFVCFGGWEAGKGASPLLSE